MSDRSCPRPERVSESAYSIDKAFEKLHQTLPSPACIEARGDKGANGMIQFHLASSVHGVGRNLVPRGFSAIAGWLA